MGKKKYTLRYELVYRSVRYKKTVTVKEGTRSDGATGATDVWGESWWVHDEMCKTGKWDDGTPVNNWQASQVLQDILAKEGRWFRAKTWFWATWLFGGGKARENGMR